MWHICIGQPHPIRGQYWVILTNHVTGSVWRVMMSWPKCSECGGDRHCTRGRSPDSLYAALLVIRSSVKLSIAKTQDIGWLGDAWNYKFPAFYLNPRVAQPNDRRQNSNTNLKNFARFGKIIARLRLASRLNKTHVLRKKMIYSIWIMNKKQPG